MNPDNLVPVVGDDEMRRIVAGFSRAAELTAGRAARRERRVEDILYGDVPTFMELPLAQKPEHLSGADAAIIGFGYEGITIKTPSLSAPPTVARPQPGSVYWRMGADLAPASIRKHSLFYSIHHNRGYYPEIDREGPVLEHLRLVDFGDVAVIPEDTEETMRRAYDRVAQVVDAGAMPVVLGGDHTVPTPTVQAIVAERRQPIGLIAFDAHMDLSYTPDDIWASNQWSKAMETGKLRPRNLVLIGIRSNRSTLFEQTVAQELGIRVLTIDEVKESGMKAVIHEAIRLANDGTDGVYVSLDIDVMEPTLVPGQKAPEIWGLTIDEIMTALRLVSRQKLIGFDVCELSPDYDVHGLGAQFCARAVVEILAGLGIRKRDMSGSR
jgi:arginase family enzyme